MKVLKFGGTSVGSVDSILSVKKIVEAIEEPVIVVVSALGGITDKLLKTASMATNGDVVYEREFRNRNPPSRCHTRCYPRQNKTDRSAEASDGFARRTG
mgnify:CR=1 FL=1